MMNVENILKVADAIERHTISDLGFNMGTLRYGEHVYPDKSGHNCGTVACIAGWTLAVLGNLKTEGFDEAAAYLGVTRANDPDGNAELFFASNHPRAKNGVGPLQLISQEQALATLRHLAATGEVDWSVAPPPPREGSDYQMEDVS